MSETSSGVRAILARPAVYRLFGRLLGSKEGRRRFVAEHVRPTPGDRVLDLGCGPGTLVEALGDVRYTGVDLNPAYIEHARDRHGDATHRFLAGDVTDVDALPEGPFDRIVCMALLHHLDDVEVRRLADALAARLARGGALVTLDNAWVDGQSRAARWMIARDRGENVRTVQGYRDLVAPAFPSVQATVTNLLRIPYTHVILRAG